MNSANAEIRNEIAKRRLKYWEVAKELEIDPATLSRWLRVEVGPARKEQILKAIERVNR